MPNTTKLLVCDLDNTLYDWLGYFVPSFYAMVEEVVRIVNCDRELLLDDFRAIHQHHHDAEHPFALLETDTIKRMFENQTVKETATILAPAFRAFNSTREKTLRLHRGVAHTLSLLNRANIVLVAHTESNLYAVIDRLTRLGLTDSFSKIYCRERTATLHPDPIRQVTQVKEFPMSKVIELSRQRRKPNKTVLLEICKSEGVLPSQSAYVGDSIARDVMMAKDAGVRSIWAKYGTKHSQEDWARLVRISHWTQEDVEWEKRAESAAAAIEPDFVAERSFRDVLVAIGVVNDQFHARTLKKENAS